MFYYDSSLIPRSFDMIILIYYHSHFKLQIESNIWLEKPQIHYIDSINYKRKLHILQHFIKLSWFNMYMIPTSDCLSGRSLNQFVLITHIKNSFGSRL